MENKQWTVEKVLEDSSNPHVLKADNVKTEMFGPAMIIETDGKNIVHHGEHGIISLESKNVLKYVQQEVNPISKKFQNVFD